MSVCLLSCGLMCVLVAYNEPVVAKRWPWALAGVAWVALAVWLEVLKVRS